MTYIMEVASEDLLEIGYCNTCPLRHDIIDSGYGDPNGTMISYCPFKKDPIVEKWPVDEPIPMEGTTCPVYYKQLKGE